MINGYEENMATIDYSVCQKMIWDSLLDNKARMQHYDKQIANGGSLCEDCYEWCSNEMRINYIKKLALSGNFINLSDKQFEISNNLIRKIYLDAKFKYYREQQNYYFYPITDSVYNMCNKELKLYYIELCLSVGIKLTKDYMTDYRELKIKEILNG